MRVGPFTYERREYTPKRRGEAAGHGWIRTEGDRRAEVGMENKILLDEIERLRAESDLHEARMDDMRTAAFTIDMGSLGSHHRTVRSVVELRKRLGFDREEWTDAELALVCLWDVLDADLDLEPS